MDRRILAIAFFSVFFISICASANEKVYYYSLGKRIVMTKSSTELFVHLKQSNLSDFLKAKGFDTKDFQHSVIRLSS